MKGVLAGVASRINEWSGKKQYNAKEILERLRVPRDGFCLIGVTDTDLFPREEWNFVFGLASLSKRTGVFSFARYSPSFFEESGPELRAGDHCAEILVSSIKVMAHEIGHMFGLRHCVFYRCLMNGSNHAEESEAKPMHLCVICLRKLQSNAKFSIVARYEAQLELVREIRATMRLPATSQRQLEQFETFLRGVIGSIRVETRDQSSLEGGASQSEGKSETKINSVVHRRPTPFSRGKSKGSKIAKT